VTFLLAFRRAADAARAAENAGAAETIERGATRSRPGATPPATLFVPMRGLDPGLEENLDAYLSLDYADYQVAFVTDRKDDPSFEVAQRASARYPDVPCRVLVAGGAVGRGQKVHNLLHALAELREQDRVLVFGDSDIRPGPSWLRDLVEPLADPQVGASTGFRWHVPVDGGPASVLRSVWNAGIASLMTGGRPPFAWGGAMAIRRETFDAAGIRERWQGALSDDYVVTSAVEDLGLTIRSRVYRPVLWRVGLAGELLGNLTFWGGLAVLAAAGLSTAGPTTPGLAGSDSAPGLLVLAALLAAAWAARGVKAWMRLLGLMALFPDVGARLRPWRATYLLATPLSSLISLSGFLRSAVTRDISWRGTRYRMVTPSRTEILD
jgi:hypothetical protein